MQNLNSTDVVHKTQKIVFTKYDSIYICIKINTYTYKCKTHIMKKIDGNLKNKERLCLEEKIADSELLRVQYITPCAFVVLFRIVHLCTYISKKHKYFTIISLLNLGDSSVCKERHIFVFNYHGPIIDGKVNRYSKMGAYMNYST